MTRVKRPKWKRVYRENYFKTTYISLRFDPRLDGTNRAYIQRVTGMAARNKMMGLISKSVIGETADRVQAMAILGWTGNDEAADQQLLHHIFTIMEKEHDERTALKRQQKEAKVEALLNRS